ncbi:MAG: N-acetylmuramoyl-L-alanine amidase [Alphaproteobacteria bacterium]|nr:N-acetylmuramoyl-L-alanine amidase [Alphaproteobacteria bacterium]
MPPTTRSARSAPARRRRPEALAATGTALRIVERPSPNHGARRDGAAIDMLVLHYTGMTSAAAALERLCDARAEVSAHYLIDRHGIVYRLVPEERRAWHAGVACWAGERDVNSRSIGIELANPGHEFGYLDFPAQQMGALVELARAILARHKIPPHRVLAHSDVAPARKIDPGEKFDWRWLAAQGIGWWPAPSAAPPADARDLATVQRALAAFGYAIEPTGVTDDRTASVIRAFQRHFRPARVDGVADPETAAVVLEAGKLGAAIA